MTIHAHGFSLWWIPPEPEYSRLSALLGALAQAHRAPRFEPHMTLLGGIDDPGADDLVDGVGVLAASLRPITIRLQEYGHERVPTRWLFRFVEPSAPVLAAHAAARRAFPSVPPKPYRPHLSLMYGDYDDALRTSIIAAHEPSALSFDVEHLHLVRTDGPPAEWARVARYELGQSPGRPSSSP